MWSFSPFLVGLVGVVWLASGLIVWATLHQYLSRPLKLVAAEPLDEVSTPAESLREAA